MLHVIVVVVRPGPCDLLPLLPQPVLGGLLLLDALLEVLLEDRHSRSMTASRVCRHTVRVVFNVNGSGC